MSLLKSVRRITTGLAVAAAFALPLIGAHTSAAAAAFTHLSGSWAGNGTISLSNGTRERIRCNATYTVSNNGNTVDQTLRCASDSYNFELGGLVNASGNSVTGNWSERTHGIGGMITGTVQGTNIRVLVDSAGFSATVTLTTQGDHMTVTISSPGSELSGASIALARR